jgi:hypothetical protein
MKKCVCECTIGMSAGDVGTVTCCMLPDRCAFSAVRLQTADIMLLRDCQMEAVACYIQISKRNVAKVAHVTPCTVLANIFDPF